jgi:hypothetical protein
VEESRTAGASESKVVTYENSLRGVSRMWFFVELITEVEEERLGMVVD